MKERTMMHTRKPSRRNKPWLALLLVLLVAGGGAGWYFMGMPGNPYVVSAEATQTPTYNTAAVRRGNIKIDASGVGTLVASQTVDLSFPTKGTVTAVNVKLGDHVTSGQVLAQMGNTDSLQAAVASAQLNLLQEQQTLSTLQQNANLSLAQSFMDWVNASQAFAKAQAAQNATAYPRCSKTTNTNLAGKLDQAKAKLDAQTPDSYGSNAWVSAENAYENALANYNYCIAYTPDEIAQASATLQAAQVTMQQAETKYNLLKNNNGMDPNELALDQAKVQQAQTQLDQAKQDLAGINLVAPMDGTVIFLAGSAGNVTDTSKFITIADLSHPMVQVSVDETDLSKLAVGSTATVVFDALPDVTFNGKVTQVSPQLSTSGQYQVATGVIQLDDSAAKGLQSMPLGLNASVDVVEQQANNVLLVPISALRSLGGGQYAVFTVAPDKTLLLKVVKVGLQDSTNAEITSGLNQGDVVSTGATQVK